MISGVTPALLRRITSAVDRSKLVLSAARIWLRIRSLGTFSFTMSATLSLFRVVSAGGGAGAASTGGGTACAAAAAAIAALCAACLFTVYQDTPPISTNASAAIPMIALRDNAGPDTPDAPVPAVLKDDDGARDTGPVWGDAAAGGIMRVV